MNGVVIVGDHTGFPAGTAAGNYVRLVSDGLSLAGLQATLVPGAPHAGPRRDARAQLWRELEACRRTAGAVVYYGHSPLMLASLRRLTRRWGVPLVLHLVEWPAAHPHASLRTAVSARAFCAMAFRVPDAVIVISHWLQAKAPPGLPVFRLPILVPMTDAPRDTTSRGVARTEPPQVVFCADLNGYLEDARLAIEAVGAAGLPDLHLVLVGRASPASREAIREAAERADLTHRVHLRTDFLPDAELRELYQKAAALLAPLRDDDRSKARFPSKLGEYLMSGTPVVSSAVGEVARHLVDRQSAFLAPPGDATALGTALRGAVTSSEAPRVGAAGRTLAVQEFDLRRQSQRLAEFLRGLTSPVSPRTPPA